MAAEDLTSRIHPAPGGLIEVDPMSIGGLLVDASPDGLLVVDRAGTILMANAAVANLFGYERDHLLGMPVEILLPIQHRQVHTAHRLRYVADPHPRPMGQELELWGRRADGAEFPIEISLSPCTVGDDDLVIAAVRDATARRTAEQFLRSMSQALDELSEGVLFGDTDTWVFSHVNQTACALTGYERDQLVGLTPLHLLPGMRRADLEERLGRLRDGERMVSFTEVLRRRDGSEAMVEIDATLTPARKGQGRQVVAMVRDVSDRLAELARQQSMGELRALIADRERIARDLHDTAIQELFAAGLTLQAAAAMIDDGDLTRRLVEVLDRQDLVIRQIRTAIFGLTTRTRSAATSLIDQTQAVLDEASRMLGFPPRLETVGPVDTVATDPVIVEAVPVVREALANVARHARASEVTVILEAADQHLTLQIVDDGIGLPAHPDPAGRGLGNLADRAAHLGGTFVASPAPDGRGTVLTWSVPTS